MEDRWYNALDRLDEHIPVYKIVDRVDAVVPSFALFLVLIVLILIILLLAFLNTLNFGANVEVTVSVASGGLPVEGAKVSSRENNFTGL